MIPQSKFFSVSRVLGMLVFMLFILVNNLKGQPFVVACNPNVLPHKDLKCDGDTKVQVYIKQYEPNGFPCPSCPDGNGCSRAYFEIRLRLAFNHEITSKDLNDYNCGDFILNYNRIKLIMGTVIEEGGLTNLNKATTENCTNNLHAPLLNFQNYFFVANESSDEASFLIDKPQNVSEDYPEIEFHDFESDVLFVMAVDVVGGEYNFGQGVYCIEFEYDNTIGSGCSGFASGYIEGNLPDPYENPGTVSQDLNIGLNSPTCDECTTTFPVYLKAINNVSQIGSLDFVFDLNTGGGTLAQAPALSFPGGSFPAPTVSTTLLPNNAGYSYHLTYTNLANITAGQYLLANVVLGPDNCSAGYDYTMTLDPGRADCKLVRTEAGAEQQKCSRQGIAECSEFQLRFAPFQSGGSCHNSDIVIKLADIVTSNGTTTNYSLIDLVFDFELDPGVIISSADFYDGNGNQLGYVTISGNQVTMFGSGSITWTANHYIRISFATDPGCVQSVSLSRGQINPGNCTPILNIPSSFFPLCKGPIHGNIKTEGGCYVQDVDLTFAPGAGSCPGAPVTIETGCGEYSSPCMDGCGNIVKWIVTPAKNDDLYETGPLSADDLLVIVLNNNNIVNFNSPYDFLAADAENDQDVDNNDVVALQQLMLGNYNPGSNPWPLGFAKSWRFVDAAAPLTPYPFLGPIPATIQTPSPASNVNFVAVKLGSLFHDNGIRPADLCADGACNVVQKSAQVHSFTLAHGEIVKSADGIIRIPVYAQSEAPLAAWQMGLQFDTQSVDFVSIENGSLANMSIDNFGLNNVSNGEIRAVWIADASNQNDYVHPGDVLFYLNFKSKGKIANVGNIVKIDPEIMESAGWLTDFTKYQFVKKSEATVRDLDESGFATNVTCRPNPSTTGFTLDITAPAATAANVTVFDMLGRRVFEKNTDLTTGMQSIAIPESMQWPSGIYRWEISGGAFENRSGQMIKQ